MVGTKAQRIALILSKFILVLQTLVCVPKKIQVYHL